MDNEIALADVDGAILAELEGMSVLEMIGAVLAAVTRYFERRLGGPGALRRLASIAAAFVAVIVALLVQRHATAQTVAARDSGNRQSRHLSHPPACWTAP